MKLRLENNPNIVTLCTAIALHLLGGLSTHAADSERAANTVILDEAGERNLGIESVAVTATDFEDTLFAIGRLEVIPSRRAVVSSRIAGRILELSAFEGDVVTPGQTVVKVESRQPGNPPPTILLTAPLGGLVLTNHASLGDPVEPDKALMEIIDVSEVHAIARVPEDQAGQLKPGTTQARIRIAALPNEAFTGELLRFGTSADPESGTLDAVFVLRDDHGHVRPHMRAEFAIIVNQRQGVSAVPKEALQGDAANPYLFVRDFDLKHAFVKAPVQIGASNDRYVEILSGLFPGDEVISKGAYSISFAGAGSVSLKEALDAAHGHEHNEDGSELTPEQAAAKAGDKGSGAAGGFGHSGPLTLFLALLSGLLFVLLMLSLFLKRSHPIDHAG